jgi:hypothetical protein
LKSVITRTEKIKTAAEIKAAQNLAPEKVPAATAQRFSDYDNTIASLTDVISKYPMGKGYSVPVVGNLIGSIRGQVDPAFAEWTSSLAGVVNAYMKAQSGTAVTAPEMLVS